MKIGEMNDMHITNIRWTISRSMESDDDELKTKRIQCMIKESNTPFLYSVVAPLKILGNK